MPATAEQSRTRHGNLAASCVFSADQLGPAVGPALYLVETDAQFLSLGLPLELARLPIDVVPDSLTETAIRNST
jgi:hypothetical protein